MYPMQNAGHQYGQGVVSSLPATPFASPDLHSTGGGTTASLRQFRKKDNIDKQSINEASNVIADNSHVARVAPHNHYPPRPNEYRYPPYPEYNFANQVKYSEIAETQNIQQHHEDHHLGSVIQKHKNKDFMDMCNTSQSHMKQVYPEAMVNQQGFPPPPEAIHGSHAQFLQKDPSQIPQSYKPSESQYYTKEQQCQQQIQKYSLPSQSRKYPTHASENDFLSRLSRFNPNMARSIMTDYHLREAQGYPNLEQNRMYPQNQRYYSSTLQSSSYPHNYPMGQHFNYPASCSYKTADYSRSHHQIPRYPSMPQQIDRSISPRRSYNENMSLNYGIPQKISPNYPQAQYNAPEYAQHYQHRRMSHEYYQQHCNRSQPVQYVASHQMPSEMVENRSVTISDSIKQYIENWADEETVTEMTQIENRPNLRVRDEHNNETVVMINPSELQYLENGNIVTCENGIPLVTENGQYVIKSGVVDNTGVVRILDSKEATATTDNNERIVNLHIVDAKSDCTVDNKDGKTSISEIVHKIESKVVIHSNTLLQTSSTQGDVKTKEALSTVIRRTSQDSIGDCSQIGLSKNEKETADKNCSPIDMSQLDTFQKPDNLEEHDHSSSEDPVIKELTDNFFKEETKRNELVKSMPSLILEPSNDVNVASSDKTPEQEEFPDEPMNFSSKELDLSSQQKFLDAKNVIDEIVDKATEPTELEKESATVQEESEIPEKKEIAPQEEPLALKNEESKSLQKVTTVESPAIIERKDIQPVKQPKRRKRIFSVDDIIGNIKKPAYKHTRKYSLQGLQTFIDKEKDSIFKYFPLEKVADEEVTPDAEPMQEKIEVKSKEDVIVEPPSSEEKVSPKECLSEEAKVESLMESKTEETEDKVSDETNVVPKELDSQVEAVSEVPPEKDSETEVQELRNVVEVEGTNVLLHISGIYVDLTVNQVNGKKVITVTPLNDSTTVDFNDNFETIEECPESMQQEVKEDVLNQDLNIADGKNTEFPTTEEVKLEQQPEGTCTVFPEEAEIIEAGCEVVVGEEVNEEQEIDLSVSIEEAEPIVFTTKASKKAYDDVITPIPIEFNDAKDISQINQEEKHVALESPLKPEDSEDDHTTNKEKDVSVEAPKLKTSSQPELEETSKTTLVSSPKKKEEKPKAALSTPEKEDTSKKLLNSLTTRKELESSKPQKEDKIKVLLESSPKRKEEKGKPSLESPLSKRKEEKSKTSKETNQVQDKILLVRSLSKEEEKSKKCVDRNSLSKSVTEKNQITLENSTKIAVKSKEPVTKVSLEEFPKEEIQELIASDAKTIKEPEVVEVLKKVNLSKKVIKSQDKILEDSDEYVDFKELVKARKLKKLKLKTNIKKIDANKTNIKESHKIVNSKVSNNVVKSVKKLKNFKIPLKPRQQNVGQTSKQAKKDLTLKTKLVEKKIEKKDHAAKTKPLQLRVNLVNSPNLIQKKIGASTEIEVSKNEVTPIEVVVEEPIKPVKKVHFSETEKVEEVKSITVVAPINSIVKAPCDSSCEILETGSVNSVEDEVAVQNSPIHAELNEKKKLSWQEYSKRKRKYSSDLDKYCPEIDNTVKNYCTKEEPETNLDFESFERRLEEDIKPLQTKYSFESTFKIPLAKSSVEVIQSEAAKKRKVSPEPCSFDRLYDWEETQSPKTIEYDSDKSDKHLSKEICGLFNPQSTTKPKPVININDLQAVPTDPSSQSSEDEMLQIYKERVSSKLNSLNIQISPKPKLLMNSINNNNIPNCSRKLDTSIPTKSLIDKFLNDEKISYEEMKKIKEIISYKRLIQHLKGRSTDKPSIRPLIDPSSYEIHKHGEKDDLGEMKLHLKKIPQTEYTSHKDDFNIASQFSDSDDTDSDCSSIKSKCAGNYSIVQSSSLAAGVPKLIIKRRTEIPQPVVRLERLNINLMSKHQS